MYNISMYVCSTKETTLALAHFYLTSQTSSATGGHLAQAATHWRSGAAQLRYLLPHSSSNQEKLEGLASAIRNYRGRASVVTVRSFDNLPRERLIGLFQEARARDYQQLARELKKQTNGAKHSMRSSAVYDGAFRRSAQLIFFKTRCEAAWRHYLQGPGGWSHRRLLTGGIRMKEERIQQFLQENATSVVGLREGSMLRVEGKSVVLKGPCAARIFRRGHPPLECAAGSELRNYLEPAAAKREKA
jgi:hypothetical protein